MRKKDNEELWRLQQELLAVEEEDTCEEDDLDLDALEEYLSDEEDYEEFFDSDYEEEYDQEPFYRNHANNYGETIKNHANRYGRGSQKQFDDDVDFDDSEFEDGDVLYQYDYKKAKKKKRKQKVGLLILAILEIAAIGAILWWWASWVL